MAVVLGLLLALLGCSAALDLALEEAWEGWKSLYAKEYSRVGPHGASSSAPQASVHVLGPAPEGSAPNVSPLVLLGGLFLTPGCSAPGRRLRLSAGRFGRRTCGASSSTTARRPGGSTPSAWP